MNENLQPCSLKWIGSEWVRISASPSSCCFLVFKSFFCYFQGNNDDLILRCCLCQCRDKAKDFMPKSPGLLIMLRYTFKLVLKFWDLHVRGLKCWDCVEMLGFTHEAIKFRACSGSRPSNFMSLYTHSQVFLSLFLYFTPDPRPPFSCKPTPNHLHSYAHDAQTISVSHVSPHQPHSEYPKDPHWAFYHSTKLILFKLCRFSA